jgi:hypothetical protein
MACVRLDEEDGADSREIAFPPDVVANTMASVRCHKTDMANSIRFCKVNTTGVGDRAGK